MFSNMGSTRLAEKAPKHRRNSTHQNRTASSSRAVSCGPREPREVMSMSAPPREMLRRDCRPRSAMTLSESMPRSLFRPSIPFRGISSWKWHQSLVRDVLACPSIPAHPPTGAVSPNRRCRRQGHHVPSPSADSSSNEKRQSSQKRRSQGLKGLRISSETKCTSVPCETNRSRTWSRPERPLPRHGPPLDMGGEELPDSELLGAVKTDTRKDCWKEHGEDVEPAKH